MTSVRGSLIRKNPLEKVLKHTGAHKASLIVLNREQNLDMQLRKSKDILSKQVL
jgi:uncharacterized protein YciI